MKYLVCVDGSDNADLAFHRALDLFHKDKDELLVIFVHSDPKEPHKREQEKSIMQNYARQLLEKIGRKVDGGAHRGSMISEPATTSVGAQIVEKAKEHNVDVVILGRRGMDPVQRFFAGSVSRYVMENSPCDVYIVKSSTEKAQASH